MNFTYDSYCSLLSFIDQRGMEMAYFIHESSYIDGDIRSEEWI